MRKIVVFLIFTMLALASLAAITVIGFYVLTASPYPPEWIGQMNIMMGGQSTTSTTHMQSQNSLAPYFGIAFLALVGLTVAGIVGMAYFLVLPEIRISKRSRNLVTKEISGPSDVAAKKLTSYDAVLRTLNLNEKKVVEVLKQHDGKYLQKYIHNDTGLSRLQTHRTVAQLAQRGIVTAEQTGNTNTVILEPWLKS